jgi:hypothetical protein
MEGQFWVEVGRVASQLEQDHGRSAYSHAAKLVAEAEREGREEDAKFWQAVSSALKPR